MRQTNLGSELVPDQAISFVSFFVPFLTGRFNELIVKLWPHSRLLGGGWATRTTNEMVAI